MFPFVVVGGGCGRCKCSGTKPKQGGSGEANYGCANIGPPSLNAEGRGNAQASLLFQASNLRVFFVAVGYSLGGAHCYWRDKKKRPQEARPCGNLVRVWPCVRC
jgi:hypothetical protein